jgi:hypothetical protein
LSHLALHTSYGRRDFLREAEIKHGRICMLAIAGWVFPELVAHLPDPAYSVTNPLAAVGAVGFLPMAQIFLAIVCLEGAAYSKSSKDNYANPGDYGWDAFGLAKSKGAQNYYRNAEIQNGRCAFDILRSLCSMVLVSFIHVC